MFVGQGVQVAAPCGAYVPETKKNIYLVFNFILFYFILFYFILFYFILFYFILFYFIYYFISLQKNAIYCFIYGYNAIINYSL